jgi:hypothetical protein
MGTCIPVYSVQGQFTEFWAGLHRSHWQWNLHLFFEQTSSFQTGGVVQNAGHRLLVQKYVPAGGAAVWYILYNSLTATSPNLSLGH